RSHDENAAPLAAPGLVSPRSGRCDRPQWVPRANVGRPPSWRWLLPSPEGGSNSPRPSDSRDCRGCLSAALQTRRSTPHPRRRRRDWLSPVGSLSTRCVWKYETALLTPLTPPLAGWSLSSTG